MDIIGLALIAFTTTAIFIRLLRPFAIKINLIDTPDNHRKHHNGSIPMIGGVAMFLGFISSILISDYDLNPHRGVFLAFVIIIVIGVLDDHQDISVKARFSFQILAVLIMCSMSDVIIHELGNLFGLGNIILNNWAIPFTVIGVIGVMNSINFIDGIDGLAAGVSLICFSALSIAAFTAGTDTTMPIIFTGITAAFLWFNLFAKRKIFLGDAGSTYLGLALAWLLIESNNNELKSIEPITAIWLLALPIFDTLAVMMRRIKQGQSPYRPDRNHLHHIFMRAGFSSKKTLTIFLLFSSLLAGVGLILNALNINVAIQTLAISLLFLSYFILLNYSWRFTKLFK